MTDFVDVCAEADIVNGKQRVFDVSGRSILVLRSNGELFAIRNQCTHLNFALAGGRQIGCEIICPAHGARFDIRTGKAVGGPAVDPVLVFEVRSRSDRIEVKIKS